jgi:hypothetical protein
MHLRSPARLTRAISATGVFLLVTVVIAVIGWRMSDIAAASGTATTAALQESGESSIVEDGVYPGAAQIQAERGITLIGGNGLITLAECGAPGLLQVRSASHGLICFQVRIWPGTDSFIVVEIPETYTIRGDDHQVRAKLITPNGETKTYDIAKNQWTPVGEGTSPEIPPETLIELRATP